MANQTRPRQMLVIAGFAKCGTTSLFSYLSQHPEICPSSVKETAFFVPTQKLLSEPGHAFPPRRFEEGWSAYSRYFSDSDLPVWLEASNYVRFPESATNLRALCPDAKLVFLVRHPLERTLSAFRFRKLVGTLAPDLSFEEYVARESHPGPHLLFGIGDLAMCRYSDFLEPFFAEFPRPQLKVVGFDSLVRQPLAVLGDICRWLEVDLHALCRVDLTPRNVTYSPRSWLLHRFYTLLRGRFWAMRRRFPRLVEHAAEVFQRTGGRLYLRLNAHAAAEETLGPEMRSRFRVLYEQETEALHSLCGQPRLLEPLRPDEAL